MIIFPAIDLINGKAVRLYKGDYEKMTVYNDNPVQVALDFKRAGAQAIHIVDLEGAKNGGNPNYSSVIEIKRATPLFCEIGGGIRDIKTVDKYIKAGIDRVILGTAALTDEAFLKEAVEKYGDKIAVGIDIRDGLVAIKGWTETTEYNVFDFTEKMCIMGVKTIICTDISKDGAMGGTNIALYEKLNNRFDVNITASGGISTLEDVKNLADLHIHGAIIGKAYYTGAISLTKAIEVANDN